MTKVVLNIRVEESEMKLLEQYCKQTGRTKTDVTRTLIRSLKRELPLGEVLEVVTFRSNVLENNSQKF
jgi:hypothetical protein